MLACFSFHTFWGDESPRVKLPPYVNNFQICIYHLAISTEFQIWIFNYVFNISTWSHRHLELHTSKMEFTLSLEPPPLHVLLASIETPNNRLLKLEKVTLSSVCLYNKFSSPIASLWQTVLWIHHSFLFPPLKLRPLSSLAPIMAMNPNIILASGISHYDPLSTLPPLIFLTWSANLPHICHSKSSINPPGPLNRSTTHIAKRRHKENFPSLSQARVFCFVLFCLSSILQLWRYQVFYCVCKETGNWHVVTETS